jgi:hypothetical protein
MKQMHWLIERTFRRDLKKKIEKKIRKKRERYVCPSSLAALLSARVFFSFELLVDWPANFQFTFKRLLFETKNINPKTKRQIRVT